MAPQAKKHPCADCRQCQWCGDDRCRLCLHAGTGCRRKLSITEQIALYDRLNELAHAEQPPNHDQEPALGPCCLANRDKL